VSKEEIIRILLIILANMNSPKSLADYANLTVVLDGVLSWCEKELGIYKDSLLPTAQDHETVTKIYEKYILSKLSGVRTQYHAIDVDLSDATSVKNALSKIERIMSQETEQSEPDLKEDSPFTLFAEELFKDEDDGSTQEN